MCAVGFDSTGKLRAWRIDDGHLMAYTDPTHPGGGIWRHDCAENCGRYDSDLVKTVHEIRRIAHFTKREYHAGSYL